MDAASPTLRLLAPGTEHILVCVGPSPGSARVVRAAHRIARDAETSWIAAGVGGGASSERLEAHLAMAEALGAEVVRLHGASVAEALLDCARQRGVTRIILGKPTHPRWLDRFRGSLVDELIRGSGPIQVQVIGTDAPAGEVSRSVRAAPALTISAHAVSLLGVAGTTALAWLGRSVLAEPDIVLLYLFAISAAAYRAGRGPGLLAAAASIGAYNFFFVPPFHTFAVADARHLLTFAVMFGVSFAISTFAERNRAQESAALERERRMAALYALNRDLSAAPDEQSLLSAALKHASRVMGPTYLIRPGVDALEPRDQACVAECVESRAPVEGPRWCLPVVVGEDVEVLVVTPAHPLDRDDCETFAHQVGLALTRVRLTARAEEAALRARTEEMRSALLSTVSHDLRTPLASITGSATALLEVPSRLPEARARELVEGIHDEANRLERLVGNLLDMTKVASGALDPRREWVPLEEIVGSALHRAARVLAHHPVRTEIEPDLPLLPVDPLLMEQVLVNLLENAARHTPPGTQVRVDGRALPGAVEVEVADQGPGLPAGRRLFEPFVRGQPHARGSGLGLAVCRGIVEAHGGAIEAGPGAAGGASFRFRIPVVGQPPAVPVGET